LTHALTLVCLVLPGAGLGVGIFSSKKSQHGVSVSSVMPDSPFDLAGVEKGDIFFEIDGVGEWQQNSTRIP
jgi:S1-C subfamily serine protease